MRIGLISDTHGLLRPQALAFLQGSDLIIHAGDIVGASVLPALARIAPVTAVRGNNDHGDWAERLPLTETLALPGCRLFVLHDLQDLKKRRIDLAGLGVQVVVSGHSHRPSVEQRGDLLFINPGSAGPRRFRLPVAVGELLLDEGRVTPRLVTLDVG